MRILAAIVLFFALMMPSYAHAATCVDDVIDLGTGICVPLDLPVVKDLPKPLIGSPRTNNPPPPTQPSYSPPRDSGSEGNGGRESREPQRAPVATESPAEGTESPGGTSTQRDNTEPSQSPSVAPRPVQDRLDDPRVIVIGYDQATLIAAIAATTAVSFLIFYRRRR